MDQSLRARLRAGDPAAFGELFDDHARAVYRYAMRFTADWAEAEDVVSLTFLEAWRLRRKLRPDDEEPAAEGDSLRPWLLAVAANVLRNTRRAARRHQKMLTRLPPREPVPDFADEVMERLADREQLAAAQAALEQLRPAEREVFALCVWSGLGQTAAAEALGVPVATLRSRLSRARARLRRLTEKELRRAAGRTQRGPGTGQIQDDRTPAVRSIQETHR